MVKVLHIANDYASSTVYMNLVRELDNLAVEQIVYTPIRGTNNFGKNAIEFASDKSEVIYSSILNWHIDRVFYPYKIFKILKDIQRKVDFSQINFIHAHTWYSDGGVAYIVAEKVELLNTKKSPIEDTDIAYFLANKPLKYTATLDAHAAYADADFVIIATPTDYDPKTNYFNTQSVETVVRESPFLSL